MSDYIKREDAINAFERCIHELGIEDTPYNYGEMALSEENVPSADVVEVVRGPGGVWHVDDGVHYCVKLGMLCPDDSDFYCIYGKRGKVVEEANERER